MLLGAAKYLAETRNFDGTVYVIFQPAEENLAGGDIMVNEGLFERCPMEQVFGLHNWPRTAGRAASPGAMARSWRRWRISRSPSPARAPTPRMPHLGIDPSWSPAHIVTALQTIVARTIDPAEGGVVTIGHINGGHAYNVIPETVRMMGTARWFDATSRRPAGRRGKAPRHRHRRQLRRQGRRDVHSRLSRDGERSGRHGTATSRARSRRRGARACHAAADDGRRGFRLHAERQAGQLHHARRRPRQGRRVVHHPRYDFNDEILPMGASYWATLAEQLLPAQVGAPRHSSTCAERHLTAAGTPSVLASRETVRPVRLWSRRVGRRRRARHGARRGTCAASATAIDGSFRRI